MFTFGTHALLFCALFTAASNVALTHVQNIILKKLVDLQHY